MARRKYVKENNLVKAINTDSLELQKPLVNEYYDINVHNSNMDKIDLGYKQNKNDISNINYELSKTENTKYSTENGVKEFECKNGYVDNIVIEGQTKILNAENIEVEAGTDGAKLVSIGQGDKIEVLSYRTKTNLIPSNITFTENKYLNYSTGQAIDLATHCYINEYIDIKPNEEYTLQGASLHLCVYDINKNIIQTEMPKGLIDYNGDLVSIKKMPSNARYIRISVDKNLRSNLGLYEGIKYDKKQILTTLRSLPNGVKDTIEKHGNKYYKIKRCGEYAYNGEDFNYYAYNANIHHIGIKLGNVKIYDDMTIANVVSNLIPHLNKANNPYHYISIDKHQELNIILPFSSYASNSAIKDYLKTNNFTVVYELATPIIEELPNFNPQTFSDKTTLLLNSGVVQGEANFEVTNSLGSELEVLKNKVSDLDDNYVSKYTLTPLNGWKMNNVEFIRDGRHIQINATLTTQGTLSKGTKIATFPYSLKPNIVVISNLIDVCGNTIGGIEIVNNFIQVNGAFDLKSTSHGCKMSFSYYI